MRLSLPAVPAFLFLLTAYALVPPATIPVIADSLDVSWQLVLTDAFLHGAQFGTDVVYTYGPFGFLANPMGDPRIYPWLVAGRLLLAMGLLLGLWLIAVNKIEHALGRFVFISAVVFLSDPAAVLPVVLLGVVLLSDSAKRILSPVVHLIAIACALTMWMKFTSLVAVGALAAALAAQDIRRRRIPVVSLEIAVSSFIFWVASGQTPGGIPLFVKGALSVARSYSAEMFFPGPAWELWFVAGLMFLLAVPLSALFFRRRPWLILPSVGWLVLMFLLQIKEAFVRHDSFHIWMGVINALLPCSLVCLCVAGFFREHSLLAARVRPLAYRCTAAFVAFSILFFASQLGFPAAYERMEEFRNNFIALAALARGRNMASRYVTQLSEFRRRRPLHRTDGTSAVFPDRQAMLYGNSLRAGLPPVPQSFTAYNSDLSGRNAAFFRSPKRPGLVFFDIAAIDNRYPTSSDTLSWLALMDCYRPAGLSASYLMLKSDACESARLIPMGDIATEAGKRVTIPLAGESAVWAQIDTRLNAAGSALSLAARPPLTILSVNTGAGTRDFRISPSSARTGFMLSPMLLTAADFGKLFDGDIDPASQVRDFAILHSAIAERLSDPVIHVRLFRLQMPRRETAR